uniref:peptidoglycan DD-metalloendopeptidase family protein n=1 Tax=Thalassotalea profundi TaxID=2036687 RepID=UPI001676E71C|nr:peptidoglycan DD-metalloendopeptidase family protein [Thalassotalea profundi]
MKNLYTQLPKKHRIILSVISVILLLLIILPSEKATASRQSENNSLKIGQRYQLQLPEEVVTSSPIKNDENNIAQNSDINEKVTWKTAKVRSGDSLAKIFKRLGFSAQTTYKVSNVESKASKQLKKLQVGDVLHIATNDKKELVALEYPISQTNTLFVDFIDGKYQAKFEEKSVEVQSTIAHGVIKTNFWNAGIESGLNDSQIINLANIFGWDIDFGLDIRKGDSFHVVYENKYIDGEFIGTGKILAAEFINQDSPFQAIRFSDGEYYSPDGKSMRKAFLRAPVNFKYISSNFKPKRFHPVQKRWKAHRGTDYAAKTGTPVVAAGNGKVTRATYDKYNGHHVFIQHGNGIETKYIHFSKRAVKKGQRVKQGQVIGYVGATGLAAGPHLHYEFLLNGVHRNPRTVKLPDAQPIAKKYKNEFMQIAKQRLKQLSGSRQALLAANSKSTSKERLQAP